MTVPPGSNLLKAQGAAYQITQCYCIHEPGQVCIEDIAMDRGVFVASGSVDGCEARLVRKGRKGVIRVSARIDEIGRRRFAIAHELGHWELHDASQWFVCSAADLRDYKKSPLETEANAFASELLMPTHLVRPLCETTEPSLQTISDMAEKFQVSLTAAAIRFVLLNKHECVLVFSKDGEVRWWFDKKRRHGLWINSRQPVDPRSLAGCAYAGEDVAGVCEQVPTDVWFPAADEPKAIEGFEQTAYSPRYRTALTLLSLDDAG